jgi:D-3-phosphoglycerate dehydrogenase / 2-oxoglutarate reductase
MTRSPLLAAAPLYASKTLLVPKSGAVIVATAPLNDYATSVFSAFGEIQIAQDLKEATIAALMTERVIALVVRGAAPVTAAVIAKAPALRVIGRTGVGYDTVDIQAATRRGIPVVYTPGAGARAVAEATFGFMLALSKRMMFFDAQLKAGNWKSRYEVQGGDLDGKVLGIVGLGRIGRIVAEMARPFNMTVIAYDPYVGSDIGDAYDAGMVSLDQLLAKSDFISMHCPMNAETKGMINATRLAAAKKGAYFINLARGGVVENLDVISNALLSGQLTGAAIDVFDPSPPDIHHPLFKHPACLTSPHAIATTAGAMTRIFKSMADDMATVLRGGHPDNVVNPETFYGSRDRSPVAEG